jgi:hypothetical protein
MEPATTEETTPDQTSPQTPQAKKDNHGITILSMAVFVILSLAAVVFLYYQNQQLKNMLADYQKVPSPAPTITPSPISSSKKFTLDWPEECQTDGALECSKDGFKIGIILEALARGAEVAPKIANLKIGDFTWERRLFITDTNEYATYLLDQESDILIQVNYYPYSIAAQNYFEQILSTFKLLGASPSPSMKACTMEARVCPDGSSVGRTGPNCEFAPCPTP